MSRMDEIPVIHQVIVAAAVKAVLGEQAVIRKIRVLPAKAPAAGQLVAWKHGIHTFWCRWTGRQLNGSPTT